MGSSDTDPNGRSHSPLDLEVEHFTCQTETRDRHVSDLRALARRSESRIVALSEQLSRSQAELQSTSTRFNELAGGIPDDLAGLSGQLSRILNAAGAEAEEMRAEARRFAEAVRVEAEQRATRIVSEAQLEFESAAALRADLDAQSRQARADIARLKEEAALNAADIVREAKDAAEEILARVHRDVDAQVELAQTKLDELVTVRANIAAQLRDFYEKFTQLDGSVGPVDLVQAVSLVSGSSDSQSTYGAHAAAHIDLTQEALRIIG